MSAEGRTALQEFLRQTQLAKQQPEISSLFESLRGLWEDFGGSREIVRYISALAAGAAVVITVKRLFSSKHPGFDPEVAKMMVRHSHRPKRAQINQDMKNLPSSGPAVDKRTAHLQVPEPSWLYLMREVENAKKNNQRMCLDEFPVSWRGGYEDDHARLFLAKLRAGDLNTLEATWYYDTLTWRQQARFEGVSTACMVKIGAVTYDCVCLGIGAVGLRAGASEATFEALANAAQRAVPQIERIVATISQSSSVWDQAYAVYEILHCIITSGCILEVISAFLGSLTWYQALLYGVTSLGTIIAMFATDGAAAIAELVIELATFGFFVDDSIKVGNNCSNCHPHKHRWCSVM